LEKISTYFLEQFSIRPTYDVRRNGNLVLYSENEEDEKILGKVCYQNWNPTFAHYTTRCARYSARPENICICWAGVGLIPELVEEHIKDITIYNRF